MCLMIISFLSLIELVITLFRHGSECTFLRIAAVGRMQILSSTQENILLIFFKTNMNLGNIQVRIIAILLAVEPVFG